MNIITGGKGIDYEAAYAEFQLLSIRENLLLKDYCAARNLTYTTCSTHFAEIKRRLDIETFQRNNIGLLLKTQTNIKEAVESDEFDPKFKASFSLDAFKAVADRSGFSPQAVTLNVQQNNQNNITLPAIFSAANEADLGMMLDASKPKADS